jgi:phage portal protein BeeE
MVLYAVPRKNNYPLSSIDAIIEDCQSNHELSLFTLGNISNGFLSMSIFKYPSGGDSDIEEEELSKKLNQLKGAKNANSILVASIDEDAENTSNLVESIPANNNDSLFIQSTINVRNTIIGSFALPRSLVGHMPESSLFNSQQISDDYVYMNLRTKDTRNYIERIFNEKLGLKVGSIVPNQFEDARMKENKPLI